MPRRLLDALRLRPRVEPHISPAYEFALEHGVRIPVVGDTGGVLLYHLDLECRGQKSGPDGRSCSRCMQRPYVPAGRRTPTWDTTLHAVQRLRDVVEALELAERFERHDTGGVYLHEVEFAAAALTDFIYANESPLRYVPIYALASPELQDASEWVSRFTCDLGSRVTDTISSRGCLELLANAWGHEHPRGPALVMASSLVTPGNADQERMVRDFIDWIPAGKEPERLGVCDLRLAMAVYSQDRVARLDGRPLDEQLPPAVLEHVRDVWTPESNLQHLVAAVTAAYA